MMVRLAHGDVLFEFLITFVPVHPSLALRSRENLLQVLEEKYANHVLRPHVPDR